jgi:hypothetical protein
MALMRNAPSAAEVPVTAFALAQLQALRVEAGRIERMAAGCADEPFGCAAGPAETGPGPWLG